VANHLRGEIDITLGEETYKCKLNFDSLVRIEQNLGIPILQLAQRVSDAQLKVTEISYILYTAIKGGGKDITEKEVNNIIWQVGFVDAIRSVGEIISMSLSSGNEEKK
jgi:hypothetical protein